MAKSVLPEEIKIGDKVYKLKDTPEILGLFEIIRGQEKDKLYGNITTMAAEIQDLKNKKATTEAEKKEKEDALKVLNDSMAVMKSDKEKIDAELAELKLKKGGNDDDDDDEDGKKKKKKDVPAGLTAADVTKAIADALKVQEEKYEKLLKGNEDKLNSKVVEDYKKELLTKNKGLIIEKLLQGTTKEELDASLVEALKESKDYIRVEFEGKQVTLAEKEELTKIAAAKKAEEEENGGGTGKTTTPKAPGASAEDMRSGEELLKDVSDMSPEEYAKHRNSILKQVGKVPYKP